MVSVLKQLISIKSAIVLLFLFGLWSGVATFIENDFGVETSWAVVYTSWWFEWIQILLCIILINNIFQYKMYKLEKLPSFIFHLSFIFILIGSGITRYVGFEGTLHVREGKKEHRVMSGDSFIQATAYKDGQSYTYAHKQLISNLGGNGFKFALDVDGEKAQIKFKEYVASATKKVVDAENGKPIISMTVSGSGESENVTLREGEIYETNEYVFSFNAKPRIRNKKEIAITLENGKFFIYATEKISWFKMVENTKGDFEPSLKQEFTTGQLYTIGGINFAPRYIGLKGVEKVIEDKTPMQKAQANRAVIVDVEYKGEKKEIAMFGEGKGAKGLVTQETIGGIPFKFEWGSRVIALPFYIKLNEFQLDRYAGSMSPMSYASEIEVIDSEKSLNLPFRVYMNHVLDYRGFRFFQSSYDQDEKGTILSVNNDPGKWPTYIGYILLGIGLFFNIANPKSRFRKLSAMIQKDMNQIKSFLVGLLILSSMLGSSTLHAAYTPDDYLTFLKQYDKKHADKFGEILVQSPGGRIKPIDTVSTELLNKVYGGSNYKGLSDNQVVLGMMSSPAEWQIQPMIKVFHPELKKIIGISPDAKYASFNDFFEKEGNHAFKLTKYSEAANRKKPAQRDQFDKDLIKVDERVNISYMVYTGEIFKIIPKQSDVDKKWFSPQEALMIFSKQEGDEVKALLSGYFEAIGEGMEKGDWSKADKEVDRLKSYQEQFASDIIPSASRIKVEIFFNHAKIFQRLTPIYLLSGLVLLMFIFAKLVKPNLRLTLITKIVFGLNLIAFIAHTAGLGLRWYISTHAPWSDSYESMIYIAWAIALAGIFFSRQSIVSLALTSILSGVTLFVAHLSWMDPQITNLVPVLKSYWLNIHVSVITASYGFLGLCALLGFFTLILFIIKKSDSKDKRTLEIERNIVEATRINEMAMILGLSLLTIGNFLGGVWANESWGRYWGWDPKETWALVSILIYAAIAHFRFVPKLSSPFAFAVASTVAFAAIIMTYFGVNFYLSGMHSYAAGDPVPVPSFVYYTIIIVALTIALAYRKRDISKTL